MFSMTLNCLRYNDMYNIRITYIIINVFQL